MFISTTSVLVTKGLSLGFFPRKIVKATFNGAFLELDKLIIIFYVYKQVTEWAKNPGKNYQES